MMMIVIVSLFSSDSWTRPVTSGILPPARSDCTLTKVDHDRAVLFGGNGAHINIVPPDIYILNTQYWVGVC